MQKVMKNGVDSLSLFRSHSNEWWNGQSFSLLRSLNSIRVPYIVEGLQPSFDNAKILDVGCGGGILSEALARLGANVTGIDPVKESIDSARSHALSMPRLEYLNCDIKDISCDKQKENYFDAVVMSEVLEHVDDVEGMLVDSCRLLKSGGSLFVTTIDQNLLSYITVIGFGEYILRMVPKGMHQYEYFVGNSGLITMLTRNGYSIKSNIGFVYDPVCKKFRWFPKIVTHYALQAIKN